MVSWRIALRYLFSKKSHSAVNIISVVSVAGVAVATAAIVIVLSVFNGFTDLAANQLSAIDPALRVTPVQGKTIASADSLAIRLEEMSIVAHAVPVIEERGLAISGSLQMPVLFKGLPADYDSVVSVESLVVDGEYMHESDMFTPVQVTTGVAVKLSARPGIGSMIGLYVPRRQGRINPANPAAAFRGEEMMLTGVVQTNHAEYDADHVYVPLEVARQLLDYATEATSLEVRLVDGADPLQARAQVEEYLNSILPADAAVKVLTRAMQEEKSFRMIQIEKWVTFLMLAFILMIAAFNIVSTLSLLVIEKRANMFTLRAMGAPRTLVNRIFIWEGMLVSVAGGILGILLGAALSLAQQYGGFVKLSGDPSQLTITTYPARLDPIDLLVVLGLVAIIAFCSSLSTLFFTHKDK